MLQFSILKQRSNYDINKVITSKTKTIVWYHTLWKRSCRHIKSLTASKLLIIFQAIKFFLLSGELSFVVIYIIASYAFFLFSFLAHVVADPSGELRTYSLRILLIVFDLLVYGLDPTERSKEYWHRCGPSFLIIHFCHQWKRKKKLPEHRSLQNLVLFIFSAILFTWNVKAASDPCHAVQAHSSATASSLDNFLPGFWNTAKNVAEYDWYLSFFHQWWAAFRNICTLVQKRYRFLFKGILKPDI